MSTEQKYFRLQHPLSGVPVEQAPPQNPYRPLGPEQNVLKQIRHITSKLGFMSERALMGIWRETIVPDLSNAERNHLRQAFESILGKLTGVQNKTSKTNNELATHYQKLTLPPEIPFIGNEKTGPSDKNLEHIFNVVEDKFASAFRGSNLHSILQEVGKKAGDNNTINSKARYPIEASLALARLLLEPPPAPPGLIVANQYFPINSIERVQFDGIILPGNLELKEESDFDLSSYINEGKPWATIQIKLPFRARYISGPKKLLKPISRHIAQFERQLARIIIHREDQHFNFPKYILFVYLRGVHPSMTHYVRFDYWRISQWREELEEMFDDGVFTSEETQRKSAHLLQVLTNEEDKMHDEIIREAEAGKKTTKTKDQLHFPYCYRLDL